MAYNGGIRVALLLQLFICANSRLQEIDPESIIRSIQIGYGQTVDCVEFYSQPSLKHPLLANHTIQMQPSSFPNDVQDDIGPKSSKAKETRSDIECPTGSVPILRRAQGFRSTGSLGKLAGFYNNGDENSNFRFAKVSTRPSFFYGSEAKLSVYEPDVGIGKKPRYSAAMLSLQNGTPPNTSTIFVGWDVSLLSILLIKTVDPILYGDNHTHFEIDWVDKEKSCTNYICHGFVQQSRRVFAGRKITPVSIIDGQKYYIHIKVFKDKKSGNWWLTYGNDYHVVGYWRKELFTYLADAADSVHWFGLVAAARGEPTAPMGSGRSPDEGAGRAAYIKDIRIVDENNNFVVPDLSNCLTRETEPSCYKLSRVDTDPDAGIHFLYGGGGCHA